MERDVRNHSKGAEAVFEQMDKNVTSLEERIDQRKAESKVRAWSLKLNSTTKPFSLETGRPVAKTAGDDPGPDDEVERPGR